jgi:hypothetical protein
VILFRCVYVNPKNYHWWKRIWNEYKPRKDAVREHLKTQQNILLPWSHEIWKPLDIMQCESFKKYSNTCVITYTIKKSNKTAFNTDLLFIFHAMKIVTVEDIHLCFQNKIKWISFISETNSFVFTIRRNMFQLITEPWSGYSLHVKCNFIYCWLA